MCCAVENNMWVCALGQTKYVRCNQHTSEVHARDPDSMGCCGSQVKRKTHRDSLRRLSVTMRPTKHPSLRIPSGACPTSWPRDTLTELNPKSIHKRSTNQITNLTKHAVKTSDLHHGCFSLVFEKLRCRAGSLGHRQGET